MNCEQKSVWCHFQYYFSDIVAVCFIVGKIIPVNYMLFKLSWFGYKSLLYSVYTKCSAMTDL